ncbi:hypothetical protein CRN75_00375 [Yersinia frederiksenii]|nr:hypothetical protein CRN75_00375 [Yersinia frederiksenii]
MAYEHGVDLRLYTEPGKLTQNRLIESFNGRFHDEHWFGDISHSRYIINKCCKDYNECRQHSTLNYLIQAKFAADWRRKDDY